MKKKIVVIDTNILVSAAIAKGYAYRVVDLFTSYRFYSIAYSVETLAEYRRVSNYKRISDKYPLFQTEVSAFIEDLIFTGKKYEVDKTFAILKDPSDNKFLDLAYACKADYLITGNHLDFNIPEFYKTKIVNPKQFWELYEAGSL